ncbi:acyl-CoA dehydrogenase family protein [Gordonia insulae]|uniref:Caffeyl-CoA reductase-Etf complex subunit CarC n=1 Tax=Gordonia insulae TaxID=2420509 RepID=A0A3G8JL91_9ACTN|nr:acyl-CoA dehydrogenase family protein [Gordonia insulae]AZG45847.1 Caffeyl-CoA reductase-Etf complex subunit CarC [Gordonia insulae]
MEFLLSDVHDDLASSVDALLTKADVPTRARAWIDGDRGPVTEVFAALADTGVNGLLIDESSGGSSAGATEMVVAMEQIGRHALPGPVVESIAVLPVLFRTADITGERLGALAEGTFGTCAIPPVSPLAPVADVAYLVRDGALSVATIGDAQATVDPTRTLAELLPGDVLADGVAIDDAVDIGTLATAAQLIGMGGAMLTLAADYAQARKQFGRAIGSFQAVKHHLADVAIAIEMARPLVHAAALGIDGLVPEDTDVRRDVAAAKVAAGDAAHLAARRALQVLGAIGYTTEHDLSLYLTKTRALLTSWGTPASLRQRVLESL